MVSSTKDEERIPSNELIKRSITRTEFCEVLGEFQASFQKEVAKSLNGSFSVRGYWASSYPQAHAEQYPEAWTGMKPKSYSIVINGAVLNQHIRSKDSLRILLCHELGHILFKQIYKVSKNKNLHVKPEGYADFFAANYCIKKLNELAVLGMTSDDMRKAAYQFSSDYAMTNGEPSFSEEQYDYSESTKLVTEHPAAKCRYTTLIIGLENKQLRKVDFPNKLPRCWFKLD